MIFIKWMKLFIIPYPLHKCTNWNSSFLNSILFAHNFSELKTDEDGHWQQRTSFNEKQTKLKSELQELEQVKDSKFLLDTNLV